MTRYLPSNSLLRNAVALAFMVLVVAGCASYRTPAPLASAGCTAAWEEVHRHLQLAGIEDAQGAEIPGYPYLRVNRTLVDFELTSLNPAQRHAWLSHALANGDRALRARLKRLKSPHGFDPDWLMRCARQEADALAADSDQWQALVPKVDQPDAYLDWRRVVGAYPLMRPILSYQVGQLEEEQAERFGTSVAGPDARFFAPATLAPAPAEVRAILHRDQAWDELGMPSFGPAEMSQLLAYHAPSLMMASGKPYDAPGSPHWNDHNWQVKPPARAYTLLSRVRWQNQWLPQLVYVFWFDKRPRPHVLDLYGGRLDGLIWRVTLDRNADVLMYESVHPCGCYLQWYPNPERLRLVPEAVGDGIMTVLPIEMPANNAASARPTLHLQSGTHYVADVRFGEPSAQQKVTARYQMLDYDELRALPDGEGGHRSLFLPNGLVPGTARLERFLLWPTGVLSPGGMRQWGHHATAFIGKRHFDDPDLLNRYFEPVP